MLEQLRQAKQIALKIKETQIEQYILKNPQKLNTENLRWVAEQGISWQKSRYKLPSWFNNQDIIFPPPLSVEQASSEITAKYKAKIFRQNFGTASCADLTGGMGIDSWALSNSIDSVVYIEQNPLLAVIAEHNFQALGMKNITILNRSAAIFLQTNQQHIANFYIDPHRRDVAKNKVFRIEDCEPNLLEIKHLLPNFMVKFSPMLDIKLAMEQLGKDISEIHIVALENEVKELLFINQEEKISMINNTSIHCINFSNKHKTQTFKFDYQNEEKSEVKYSKPSTYIYEPNASVLKAGAFKSIATHYGLEKIAPNSHLYTSEKLLEDFVGRIFFCEAVCKFDKKTVLSKLPGPKANISTRNFPMKPEEIKKKLGLQDGGDYYLFATENIEKQKIILVCKKIEPA